MIPQEFSTMNLPSIFKWASDKMQYITEQASKEIHYDSETWFFTGLFDKRRKLNNFYEFKVVDGIEYHAIMNVIPPKFVGQKTRVTISLLKAKQTN